MTLPALGRDVGARDALAHALDRATGARAIEGNALRHFPDSAAALEEMLAAIAGARRWVHFENYIIRDDRTGRRFADALAARAGARVAVRVLYDALGSRGTGRAFWRRLRRAGVAVRAFNPILSARPFGVFRRDHRKLLAVDGERALVGGACIGGEWAGDPERGRPAWRDTMLEVCGPAAAALDRTFGRVWRRAGPPLPEDELNASPEPCGPSSVRVVDGLPGEARTYRAEQIVAAGAAERLWITDAYFAAPPALTAALVAAARSGVDVRFLGPSTSDIPVVRNLTRIGYRELLEAGVRIFEWLGPMLHSKTMLADRRWARIGSSNLNWSSLLVNYELDAFVEDARLADELAAQFRRDLASSREIVLQPRRRFAPKVVGTGPPPPARRGARSGYALAARAAVTLQRVAGGLRRTLAAAAALALGAVGTLLLVFPRVMSVVFAVGAFWLALGIGWYAVAKRRWRRGDDVP